jgi:hypothetical protein
VGGKLVAARQVDPRAGLTLSIATPDGGTMSILSRTFTVKGKGARVRGRSTEGGGTVSVTLARTRKGFRFAAVGKRLDLAALDTANRDLTVSLEIGGTTFTLNRNLVEKKGAFRLPRKRASSPSGRG